MISPKDLLWKVEHSDLSLRQPKSILTLTDIGMPQVNSKSTIAFSEPFPLFSANAIEKIRRELPIKMQVTGEQTDGTVEYQEIRPKFACYTRNIWTHPKTVAHFSNIAGIALEPVTSEISTVKVFKREIDKEQDLKAGGKEEIIPWHKDQYPFTCILMMSDTVGVQGGEILLRAGLGKVVTINPMEKGWAILIHGSKVEYAVSNFTNSSEWITAVTFFQPAV